MDLAANAGGYSIALVGWTIVFLALVILIFVFMLIPKVIEFFIANKLKKSQAHDEREPIQVKIAADVNTAIAMALHLYFNEMHDEESNVITIKNAPKQYSPWSSKIYSVTNQPQR